MSPLTNMQLNRRGVAREVDDPQQLVVVLGRAGVGLTRLQSANPAVQVLHVPVLVVKVDAHDVPPRWLSADSP